MGTTACVGLHHHTTNAWRPLALPQAMRKFVQLLDSVFPTWEGAGATESSSLEAPRGCSHAP